MVQYVGVLIVLCQTLQHGQRLAEIHRHGYFGQILAYAVLHDAPQVEGVVRLVWDTGAPLPLASVRGCRIFICFRVPFSACPGYIRVFACHHYNLTLRALSAALNV